jgi:ABC-type sugar transport system ATPase subunit
MSEHGSSTSTIDIGSTAAPAARAIDLMKTYGAGETAVRALDGVTVDFERGRFTAVMGPSGSGKSTLMHCMAGLDVPTGGRAFIGEDEIGRLDDGELTRLRRDRIGFVFQAFNLVPTLSAGDNITLPAELAHAEIDRGWFDYLVGQLGIADRLSHRLRPSAPRPARADLRRRAYRQPGLQRLRRGTDVPAPRGGRASPDDRDGHARPGRRGLRRPGGVPRRR